MYTYAVILAWCSAAIRANVEILVAALFQAVSAVGILFVDDHSQDGTQEKIARIQHQYRDKVYLLPRADKLGLGMAYVAGVKWALA